MDPIPAEKRAYYDAVAAAYARLRAAPSHAPPAFNGAMNGAFGQVVMKEQGALMIPLVGCGMRFGIPRGWKSYHDKPPNSLKVASLGPLSCFLLPPNGLGSEESGVEAAASLRERNDDAAHMKALDPAGP